nr:organic cation/carnitine transporter 4 [Tanacetum cinerariifolium]
MTTTHNLRQPLIPPPENPEKAEKSDIERLCIDDMLQKYCGEFGAWQMRHFVLTCMAWALAPFHTMVMIFADKQPEFTCEPPGLMNECDVCGGEPGSWRWEGGGGVVSTVAEWGLVCGDKYKVGLVQAFFFAGCMIGKLNTFDGDDIVT